MIPLPNKKYHIIYADPAWKYDFSKTSSRSIKYETCDMKTLCDIPVGTIAEDDSVLLMWATFPRLDWAVPIMNAWGFKYVTMLFTWIKTNKDGTPFIGLGYYTRSNPEVCLLGKKGKGIQAKVHDISSIVHSPIREHSRKPDEIREHIVRLFGDVSRIELFARQRFEGWDAWGNELTDKIIKKKKMWF